MSTETIRIQLEDDALAALRESATAERRPLNWQAEVMLRRALGLPFPLYANSADRLDTREAVSDDSR